MRSSKSSRAGAALTLPLAFFCARFPASADTIADAIAPPPGYVRILEAPGSFGSYLRGLQLWPAGRRVHLFNGRLKERQDVHFRVLRLDVGPRDLQQCADAVMRLRAEFLYDRHRFAAISFAFTNGTKFPYEKWARGWRPLVHGNRVRFAQRSAPRSLQDRTSFRRYLDTIFTYAGSASLEKELTRSPSCRDVRAGDVFIQGGFPGHAVLVVDVAARRGGRAGQDRVFLLAQSYMPAQEIHVLSNPSDNSLNPWYRMGNTGKLMTPEWDFRTTSGRCDLRRWP